MIARDIALAVFEEARIHVQHLSAVESVDAIEAAKASGVRVTCEATPHHLTLTDEAVRSLDSRFKMNPPLRTEADRQALIEALRSGTIDCIATDHAPHTSNEKEVPFEQAAMGVTGLETAFSVALHRARAARACSTSRSLVERLTGGAEPLGFDGAADRAAAPRRTWPSATSTPSGRSGADGWESRSENSCFAGRTLRGPGADDGRGGAGRLPAAQLRDGGRAIGGRVKLDPERDDAGRDRRPGGLPQGAAVLRRRRRRERRPSCAAPPRSASRSSSPSSTRKGLGATVPEVAEHSARVGDGARARCASRPPRPTASTSASATRRSSAGSRRTSASTRRCSTCSTRTSRCTSPRTPSARAPTPTASSGLAKMERAGALRRPASRRRCSSCSGGSDSASLQGSAGAGEVTARRETTDERPGYVLLEDGTRFDGDSSAARRPTPWARSSSTPR